MHAFQLLEQLDAPLEVDACRFELDKTTRRLRVCSHAIYRDWYVYDRVLYSGAFGDAPDDASPQSLVETFRLPFLADQPRGEFSFHVEGSGHSDAYPGDLSPREETSITLEQSVGPYTVRFVIALVPGLPFLRSMLFVRGPAWTPDSPPATVDKNLAFASMEDDPQGTSRLLRPPEDTVDAVPHGVRHGTLEKSTFFDDTDRHDFLIEKTTCDLYGYDHPHEGNHFLLRDRASGQSFLMVKDGPTIHSTLHRTTEELFWRDEAACGIRGSGIDPRGLSPEEFTQAYGAILGVGDRAPDLLRAYMAVTGPRTGTTPIALSNTWGDRSRDAELSESFARKEIDVAAELGIDFVQLDDGWQAGVTKNSGLAKGGVWEGYYATDENFWSVDPKKFSSGLEPVVAYARDRSVRLGLWFSPDSSHSFANWRRDADVLLDFYRSLGIDQFKLDGIKLRDKEGERNLLRLLNAIETESDGRIDYCMDVTAEIRLGYIYGRRHGKIFLENRYTDWGNYFPYRTLRNLWMIAHHMPARRVQVEVLNNRRNASVYGDDPLAPIHYRMDYLFAIAMPATPLFFMELSNLSREARDELAPIMKVHRAIRSTLINCDIIPIGTRPDGYTFTGFQCAHPDGGGFLILFRDASESDSWVFTLPHPLRDEVRVTTLYDSAQVTLDLISATELRATFAAPRSCVVAQY